MNMEKELPNVEDQKKWNIDWQVFMQELKHLSYIAAPMVLVSVLQYALQVVSVIMVGHLSQLALSSVAIATSLTNVTGFSLLSGMVGGLETLCGQAYGAKQYQKLGVYTYSAIFSLILVCIPVSVLWFFMEELLLLMKQDVEISREAQKYAKWLIPSLFGGAISKPLVRYLQTQSLTFPMLLSSFLVLCFHVPATWVFIYKLKLGSIGAAIAFCISNWLYVALLAFYIKFSVSCKKTSLTFSSEAFRAMGQFFHLAIPSAVMVCLKWWSLELLIILCGLLPNPTLETSVLSICLTISTLHFTVPYGFGAAVSTRVSNELGAGNPHKARVAVWAAMFLAVAETSIVTIALFSSRKILGRAYSDEKQVVHYIAIMTPLICLSTVTDSLQAVISGWFSRKTKFHEYIESSLEQGENLFGSSLFHRLLTSYASGIARGSGWQKMGAYVNLAAFYMVGTPVAIVLGFKIHLKAKGFWIGIVIGSAIQSIVLSLIAGFTDWQKQANKSRERIYEGKSLEELN